MGAIFITGSGTDVGKTFVAAALIRRLKAQGLSVEALKPVVSGYNPDNPAGSDPAVLLEALALPMTEENLAKTSPWRFRAPLSPDMAAATEGRAIDMGAVAAFCARAVSAAKDALVIEGAGGVMSPVGAQQTQADLMSALDIPVIFVAGSYLGAISHALTGLDALKCRGLELRALVVNESPDSPVELKATCASLENFTNAPVLALRRSDAAANGAVFARLATLI
jgi:dethiobiotin synthetase